MTSTELIKKLELIHKIENKKYITLIDGNWGIGKTYSYEKYVKNHNFNNIYISLFNITTLNEIDKKIILKYFFKNNSKFFENKILEKISPKGIFQKITKINTLCEIININSIFEILDVNTLNFDKKTIICFDDLERLNDNIEFKNLLGKIEQLHNKVNIIIVCNTEKLSNDNKKVFNEYKEKIIDNIYSITKLDSEFVENFIKELKLKKESNEFLKNYFLENGNNNLRYLIKIKDKYKELKLICNNEEWFLSYEKDILNGIICLEAENCFQVYSKKNLENLKSSEKNLQSLNLEKEIKTEEELKKEVDFLNEFPSYLSKIIKILYSYNLEHTDIKLELQNFFQSQKEHEKFYQLCDLYFLKGESEILKSFKRLKKLFSEQFNKMNNKYKFYSFIVLNRYLKDLKLRKLSNSDLLTLDFEKEKLKNYIKKQRKQGLRINYLKLLRPYLNNFDMEEINILNELQKEIDKEIDEEINEEINFSLKNKNFNIFDKYYLNNLTLSYTNNDIKNFFDILLCEDCPEEYWDYCDKIFCCLDENSKIIITKKIEENIKNEKNYILKLRNQFVKETFGIK